MDEELERMVVSVRADTGAFARDVTEMRGAMESALGDGAEMVGRRIEGALARAVRTGKLGFDDLRQIALSTMASIAQSAVKGGIGSLLGTLGLGAGGGLLNVASGLIQSGLGLPGRATGGPVAPGRAYRVGERGPELFVPTASGRVETGTATSRDVRVSITVKADGGDAPRALAKSGRQVARAVRQAIERAEG
jgi:hypothetical protein